MEDGILDVERGVKLRLESIMEPAGRQRQHLVGFSRTCSIADFN